MIHYKPTQTSFELEQILALQKRNLPDKLTEEEKKTQGFVTVHHELSLLKEMHDIHPHIIATHNNEVVGYALSMSKNFRENIPILIPMFTEIDNSFKSKENYLIMGQICIEKNHRGKGIFRGLYQKMSTAFSHQYKSIITEIDAANIRSINAHSAVGFQELTRYTLNQQVWVIVYLDL